MNLKSLLVLVLIIAVVKCDDVEGENGLNEENQNGAETEKQAQYPKEFLEHYTKLFREKRKQQQEAVKRILDMKDNKKSDLFSRMYKKIFETLLTSLQKISKIQSDSGSKDGRIAFDKEVANEVSSILENTAFCADLALHFPSSFHKLYDKNAQWQTVLETSIAFTLKSNLIDEDTQKAIHLMSQELNIIEKEPNYVNPYKSQKKLVDDPVEDESELKKKKKKEKRKRGPGLSGSKNEL